MSACLETATHMLDISSEVKYIREVQSKYDEEARKKGIYLISACGFASIPPDLSLGYLKKNCNEKINSAEIYLRLKAPSKVIFQNLYYL